MSDTSRWYFKTSFKVSKSSGAVEENIIFNPKEFIFFDIYNKLVLILSFNNSVPIDITDIFIT
jgi:hypothetical protein